MNVNDIHLEALHRVQPHLRNLYYRANEIMPHFLMSDRYSEAIILLQREDIHDEKKDAIQTIQRHLVSGLLRDALRNVPFYKKNVKLNPDTINPGNAI